MIIWKCPYPLWFAWKIVLLQYRKQRNFTVSTFWNSCDLLEKSYFCSIANNFNFDRTAFKALWFAWKIVLLQYRKQQDRTTALHVACCDLLEKSYFCSIANNVFHFVRRNIPVVICLKNRTFAVSQTTAENYQVQEGTLWFAWKIVLLQYRKQRLMQMLRPKRRCDLLEKSYFCSIANNLRLGFRRVQFVVICLKNRTFAVSQTTSAYCLPHSHELWFAWKIVLLQYRKQPISWEYRGKGVVICLKNRTFAVSQTTWNEKIIFAVWLWFAWKIVLLQYRKQQANVLHYLDFCCDLLEKSYFCSIANNLRN